MNIIRKLTEIRDHLERNIRRNTAELSRLPKGNLIISRNRIKPGFNWMVSRIDPDTGRTTRTYISRKNVQLATELCLKKFLDNQMRLDKKNLKAINEFLSKFDNRMTYCFTGACKSEYNRLLRKARFSMNSSMQDYLDKKYPLRSTYKPEALRVQTLCGIMVRSKSEAIIADLLYNLGIPFVYEPVIIVNGKRLAPDFIIMDPITKKEYLWEHFGMLDDPQYVSDAYNKLISYNEIGWRLGINLMVTSEDAENKFVEQHARDALSQVITIVDAA